MTWNKAEHVDKGPKVCVIGPTGSYKTRTFLAAGTAKNNEPPRMLVLDYEDGTDHYDGEFSFARVKIPYEAELTDPRLALTKQEVADLKADRYTFSPILEAGKVYGVDLARVTIINRLAASPLDFVLVDSVSMHYQMLFDKWLDIFYKRETKSPGHRRDYYTMQPRDYDKPARELQMFVKRLLALNVGVFMTSQEKAEYAEGEIMKKIGMQLDAHRRLPYLLDTVIHLEPEEEGKAKSAEKRHTSYVAVIKKDRTGAINERFKWVNNDAEGYSKSFLTRLENVLGFKGRATELPSGEPEPTPEPEAPKVEAPPPPLGEVPEENDRTNKCPVKYLEALKELKDLLGVDTETWRDIMLKRGVSTARNLTEGQALDVIVKLYNRLETMASVSFLNRHFDPEKEYAEYCDTFGKEDNAPKGVLPFPG